MFPEVIHFVWIGNPMPSWAVRCVDEFRRLNPSYEVMLHSRDALLPEYAEMYEQRKDLASKSDLIRYSVLEKFGGWYFDVDTFPMRPLRDIDSAYEFDGKGIVVGAQYPETHRLWLANGAIGVPEGWQGWDQFKEMLLATDDPGRVALGPALVTRFAREYPDLVVVIEEPWFYAVKPAWATKALRCVLRGQRKIVKRLGDTKGQMPFSFHLWASNKLVDLGGRDADPKGLVVGSGSRSAMVACPSNDMKNLDKDYHPYRQIAEALADLGFQIEILHVNGALEKSKDVPEVIVLWNGRREPQKTLVEEAESLSIPVIRLEHGFFDRRFYSQADHEGILHWASWRRKLKEPAPPEGAEKLAKFYPQGIQPMRKKKGYILVIGQVTEDSQMDESSIKGSIRLQRVVHSVTRDIKTHKTFLRPHPAEVTNRPYLLPVLESQEESMRYDYIKNKHGSGLEEAIAGASFLITINSNTINEALAMGVPTLAFGPHLAIEAGVVKRATEATLVQDIREMIEGWRPEQSNVENYMQWLACRQWNPQEFRDPEVIRVLVEAAGVKV